MTNWDLDPDWCAVAQNSAHAQHHIHVDAHGGYICRECSVKRLHVLSDAEVKRLLLIDRVQS